MCCFACDYKTEHTPNPDLPLSSLPHGFTPYSAKASAVRRQNGTWEVTWAFMLTLKIFRVTAFMQLKAPTHMCCVCDLKCQGTHPQQLGDERTAQSPTEPNDWLSGNRFKICGMAFALVARTCIVCVHNYVYRSTSRKNVLHHGSVKNKIIPAWHEVI